MSANRTIVLVHPLATEHWSAQPWCDLPLELICEHSSVKPFKQTNWLASAVARACAPVARKRVNSLFDRVPLEILAAKHLGLYAYES